jgi:hypothetical protein
MPNTQNLGYSPGDFFARAAVVCVCTSRTRAARRHEMQSRRKINIVTWLGHSHCGYQKLCRRCVSSARSKLILFRFEGLGCHLKATRGVFFSAEICNLPAFHRCWAFQPKPSRRILMEHTIPLRMCQLCCHLINLYIEARNRCIKYFKLPTFKSW